MIYKSGHKHSLTNIDNENTISEGVNCMDTKIMNEFLDIYNSIKCLFEQGYLSQNEYYQKIDTLAYNITGRMALLTGKEY